MRNIGGRATVRYRSEASVSTMNLKYSCSSTMNSVGGLPFPRCLDSAAHDCGCGSAEQIRIHALRLRLLARHYAASDQVGERHIHGLHAVFLTHLHGAGNLVDLAFTYQVTHRRGS